MKRRTPADKHPASPEAKRSSDDTKHLEALKQSKSLPDDGKSGGAWASSTVEDRIQDLDDECAKEQFKLQRAFAPKLRKLTEERQSVLSKLPGVWGVIIARVVAARIAPICNEDKEVLELLEEVDVEDDIDERGSYAVTFKFSPEVSRYFLVVSNTDEASPAAVAASDPVAVNSVALTKSVTIKESDEVEIKATRIQWAKGKNIPAKLLEKRRRSKANDEEEISIFSWFSQEDDEDSIPLGEVLVELWRNLSEYLVDKEEEETEEDDGAAAPANEDTEDDEDEEDDDGGGYREESG